MEKDRLNGRGKLKRSRYEEEFYRLKIELVKRQRRLKLSGAKAIVLFEGRSLSGKVGAIRSLLEPLDPSAARFARCPIAEGESFLARYSRDLPLAGEIAFYDRGWYREADDAARRERFIHQAPLFEKALVEEGCLLLKYFLEIDRSELAARLEKQKSDELGRLRLSERDAKSLKSYDEYSRSIAETILATHAPEAPWFEVDANDKRAARIEIARHILSAFDSKGKARSDFDSPIVKIHEPKVRF